MSARASAVSVLERLDGESRVMIEALLAPSQGVRFQPTGFPDLGAATFQDPNGKTRLLVESPQSIANRLEAVSWDEASGDLVEPLRGLPYVRVRVEDERGRLIGETSSILEAHRLNSPYIMQDKDFQAKLREKAGIPAKQAPRGRQANTEEEESGIGPLDRRKLAQAVFAFDPGSVLHGVFLEKLDGRARLTRALSGFIEADNARPAVSGGVKNDRVDPAGNTQLGFGNVPFTRVEYVAESIIAYFNFDVALLRAYGLPDPARQLLLALGLWKVRRFLDEGLRLRTACDFVVTRVAVRKPEGVELPESDALEPELQRLIRECRPFFADPPVTRLTMKYERTKRAARGDERETADENGST